MRCTGHHLGSMEQLWTEASVTDGCSSAGFGFLQSVKLGGERAAGQGC